jgi:alpha-tubulin suppressor-like RCC1 family protein
MKSITPVISIILLVALTIAASGAAYFFIMSTTTDLKSGVDTSSTPFAENSRLRIVSLSGTKALIRNDGTSTVSEIIVFVNGELYNYTLNNPIQPGQVTEIPFNARQTAQDLEIKILYGIGKSVEYTSPARLNTNDSGFTNTPLLLNEEEEPEPENLNLTVNNSNIISFNFGLKGYCNANSSNSNDILMYNFTWMKNGIQIINNIKFKENVISVNLRSSCGILENGSAMCWGDGGSGELGNGLDVDSNVPVYVSGNHVFNKISVGSSTVCAISVDGNVFCWGYNYQGKLGNGKDSSYTSSNNENVPTLVRGYHNFSSISLGYYHSCGILTNGSAMCWGSNENEILGCGISSSTIRNSLIPIYVYGNHVFKEISLNWLKSCAVLTNGSAVCWGDNYYGTLGNGSSGGTSNIPVFVSGNYEFSNIATANTASCALLKNGSAMCWGRNTVGELGNGEINNSYIPIFVSGNYEFSSINGGFNSFCGILTNNSAVCWGSNSDGQLGNGSTGGNSNIPVFVSGNYNFSSISVGDDFGCGILTNGSAICWGDNFNGQLGNGVYGGSSNVPVFVVDNHNFKNNSIYWNNNTFISSLHNPYYSISDEISFNCNVLNFNSESSTKSYYFTVTNSCTNSVCDLGEVCSGDCVDEIYCFDSIDNDNNGDIDCDDSYCQGLGLCETTCDDDLDNDGDGYFDCFDEDCDGESKNGGTCEWIIETTCDDEFDNNANGYIDCLDLDCDGESNMDGGICEFGMEMNCADLSDNDGDGMTDCDDDDCMLDPACPETDCSDSIDNDEDSFIDCADEDCFGEDGGGFTCEYGMETDCSDGYDNDGDGMTDCDDDDCDLDPVCGGGVESDCSNGLDDDGDELTDCADDDCDGQDGGGFTCEYGMEMNCADLNDNDGDFMTDCDDDDCMLDPACDV